jgi:hypothetical protein
MSTVAAVRFASHSAIGLSITVVILCFGYLPIMWHKMASIQQTMRDNAEEFRIIETDAWMAMRIARKQQQVVDGDTLTERILGRMRRQAASQQPECSKCQ